ncbi:MAG: coenzyme F420-0:L-glutamate ligase [Chloroflexi bacterium]|nr:coenzyme F420-0:L-glutamate ligase [Chloroflexota bacterium]
MGWPVKEVRLIALAGLPLVAPGDDLVGIICDGLVANEIAIEDGDVLVIAQKIISKAEGRVVRLDEVTPSSTALDLAATTRKDPRLVQVILEESSRVVRAVNEVFIVEQRLGCVCANAGVDRSNVGPEAENAVALLPLDPDASADRIRSGIEERTGTKVAVIINDSHGRPFREGAVGVALGVSGIAPIADKRGATDLFGYRMRTSTVAIADEIASAASMLMGQTDEGLPVVLIRGLGRAIVSNATSHDLLRAPEKDLFR